MLKEVCLECSGCPAIGSSPGLVVLGGFRIPEIDGNCL